MQSIFAALPNRKGQITVPESVVWCHSTYHLGEAVCEQVPWSELAAKKAASLELQAYCPLQRLTCLVLVTVEERSGCDFGATTENRQSS